METIRTIKGFDHELKCRGFQYEVGKTYTANGKIELCRNGFHAIRNDVNPLVVLEYYEPVRSGKPSRYCIVDCSGDIEYDEDKLCCSTIMIVEEITLEKLHELSHEWIESHSDEVESGGDCSSIRGGDNSSLRGGYCSSLSGGNGSSLRGGDNSSLRGGDNSSLSGGDGSSIRGGYRSSLRGGYCSSLRGGNGSSLRGGYCSSLSGGDGSSIRGGGGSKFCGGKWSTFFVEILNDNGELIGIATAIVDGKNYKENQWYEFTDGAWRECDNQENQDNL